MIAKLFPVLLLLTSLHAVALAQPPQIIRNPPQYADTVAAIASQSFRDGQLVVTKGYTAVGDVGANEYIYHSTGRSGITPDGGFYIVGPGSDDYLEARDKSVARPKQFGAAMDGVTDDRAVLQACLNTGVPVELERGTFRVEAPLAVSAGTRLSGQGMYDSIITAPISTVGLPIEMIIDGTGISDVVLKDFTITCSTAVTSDDVGDKPNGIYVGGTGSGTSTDWTIENVRVHNIPDSGIQGFNSRTNWTLLGCRIYQCGGAGLNLSQVTDASVIGCYFAETGDNAIGVLESSNNVTISGNVFYRGGCWPTAFPDPIAGNSPAVNSHSRNINITGNTFRECAAGIQLKGFPFSEGWANSYQAGRKTLITGNTFEFLLPGTSGDVGCIILKGASNVVIANNFADARYTNGVAGEALTLKRIGSAQFKDNVWITTRIAFREPAERVTFERDRFHFIRSVISAFDALPFYTINNRGQDTVQWIDCEFSDNVNGIYRNNSGAQIQDLTIDNPRFIRGWPVGFVNGTLADAVAITSIPLKNSTNVGDSRNAIGDDGLRFNLVDNQPLWVCRLSNSGGLERQAVTLNGAHSMGAQSLTIDSWTPTGAFTDTACWVTLRQSDSAKVALLQLTDAVVMPKVTIRNSLHAKQYATHRSITGTGIITALYADRSNIGAPEGLIFGSIGDRYTNTASGISYIKTSGNDTNTGWTDVTTPPVINDIMEELAAAPTLNAGEAQVWMSDGTPADTDRGDLLTTSNDGTSTVTRKFWEHDPLIDHGNLPSGTQVFSFNVHSYHSVTATGDIAIEFATSHVGPHYGVVVQDATGGRVITINNTMIGTAPTIDTAANAKTLLPVFWDGTDFHWIN